MFRRKSRTKQVLMLNYYYNAAMFIQAGIPASSLREPEQFPVSRICMDANPAAVTDSCY
jgi:hypothetical protein